MIRIHRREESQRAANDRTRLHKSVTPHLAKIKRQLSQICVSEIQRLQPAVGKALAVADAGLSAYPQSSVLWCRRGELILLSDQHQLEPARESFEQAIEADPAAPEAYRLLGDYYDCALDDPCSAEPWYLKSIELGGDIFAHEGFARCLAEQNQIDKALNVLSEPRCPFSSAPEIVDLKGEILEGLWTTPARPQK